jgi:hypothetical protein
MTRILRSAANWRLRGIPNARNDLQHVEKREPEDIERRRRREQT